MGHLWGRGGGGGVEGEGGEWGYKEGRVLFSCHFTAVSSPSETPKQSQREGRSSPGVAGGWCE